MMHDGRGGVKPIRVVFPNLYAFIGRAHRF